MSITLLSQRHGQSGNLLNMVYIAQSNYLFSRNINFSFDISSVTTFWKIASTYDTRYVRTVIMIIFRHLCVSDDDSDDDLDDQEQ